MEKDQVSDRIRELNKTSVGERLHAIEQLKRLAPDATAALETLRAITNGPNGLLRRQAVDAIGRINAARVGDLPPRS
jgi:hypothetical protein